MVGPLNMPDSQVPEVTTTGVQDAPKSGIAGFLASRLGKLILGAVAVVVILGILGAIALFFFIGRAVDEGLNVVPVTGANPATATAEAAIPTQRKSPQLSDRFAFRNIFRPTVKPAVTVNRSTDGSQTAADGSAFQPDTLYLQSVSSVDGKRVATFHWNGTSYTAGENEELTGTPWKVLTISGNSATMLFGDSQVTLTVGQGMGK